MVGKCSSLSKLYFLVDSGEMCYINVYFNLFRTGLYDTQQSNTCIGLVLQISRRWFIFPYLHAQIQSRNPVKDILVLNCPTAINGIQDIAEISPMETFNCDNFIINDVMLYANITLPFTGVSSGINCLIGPTLFQHSEVWFIQPIF